MFFLLPFWRAFEPFLREPFTFLIFLFIITIAIIIIFFLPIYILKKEKDEINFGLRPSIFVDQKSEKLFYKRLYFPHRMVGE